MKLEAKGIGKRFGKKRVLAGVDLALGEREAVVLLGANGAGKSTLLRLALGLLRPDAGSLSVCGFDPVREGSRVRQAVGYVPDRPDAYPWMTTRDLFRFLRPQYAGWDEERAASMLADLSVPLDTPFRSMSRGEGMKAMLCAALAHRPELLLLDEPFAGLDPLVREEVLRGVLAAHEGATLCVTHDLDVASRLADRTLLLSEGRIAREEAQVSPRDMIRMLGEVAS